MTDEQHESTPSPSDSIDIHQLSRDVAASDVLRRS